MGISQVAFVGVLPEVTWPVRKYVMRMRNRKLRNILPSGAFSPEVTSVCHVTGRDPVRKRPWPEVCSVHPRIFPRVVFLTRVVVQFWSEVTSGWRHRKRPCPEVCPGFCFEPICPGLYPLASSSPTERNSWSELDDVHVAWYWSVKKIQNTNDDFLNRYIVGTRT